MGSIFITILSINDFRNKLLRQIQPFRIPKIPYTKEKNRYKDSHHMSPPVSLQNDSTKSAERNSPKVRFSASITASKP